MCCFIVWQFDSVCLLIGHYQPGNLNSDTLISSLSQYTRSHVLIPLKLVLVTSQVLLGCCDVVWCVVLK
jgi:hypothetical protein